MRQVGEAELIWAIRYRLSRLSAALRNGLGSRVVEHQRQAEQMVAQQIVREGLARYEVLSDTPLPPGSDLFTGAAFGGGDGSSPRIDDAS